MIIRFGLKLSEQDRQTEPVKKRNRPSNALRQSIERQLAVKPTPLKYGPGTLGLKNDSFLLVEPDTFRPRRHEAIVGVLNSETRNKDQLSTVETTAMEVLKRAVVKDFKPDVSGSLPKPRVIATPTSIQFSFNNPEDSSERVTLTLKTPANGKYTLVVAKPGVNSVEIKPLREGLNQLAGDLQKIYAISRSIASLKKGEKGRQPALEATQAALIRNLP